MIVVVVDGQDGGSGDHPARAHAVDIDHHLCQHDHHHDHQQVDEVVDGQDGGSGGQETIGTR